jgi:hypothetical protein
MKARSAAISLIMALILTLALVAPTAAAPDEAQIKSIVKQFMTLLAKGDFNSAVKLKIRKLRIPPQDSFKYRMITRLAGAYKGIERIEVKGDLARAYVKLDPKVVNEVVHQIYQFRLEYAKKIKDPKKRDDMVKLLEKNKDRIIARQAKRMNPTRVRLQKKAGKWMIY